MQQAGAPLGASSAGSPDAPEPPDPPNAADADQPVPPGGEEPAAEVPVAAAAPEAAPEPEPEPEPDKEPAPEPKPEPGPVSPRAPDVELPPRPVLPEPPPPAPRAGAPWSPRPWPVGRRTVVVSAVLVATVVAAGAGVVALDRQPGPAPVPQPVAAAAPVVPGAVVPGPAPSVLPPVGAGTPVPSAAGLRRVIGPLLRTGGLGSSVSADIVDLAAGTSLLEVAPTRPTVPASSAKLLTGAAALSLLGPAARLDTTVVDGAGRDEIVLVGGGDVTLAAGHGAESGATGRAGMADLADRTAAALRAQGRTQVAVRLDDTLFAGSPVNPAWSPGDVRSGFIAPVTALAVNSGSVDPATPIPAGEPAPRSADPALAAAQLFAQLLGRDGIRVTGPVARAKAPDSAGTLARVSSAPVGDLVEHALTDSDNTVAEALAKVVAVRAGRQGTFADAGVAVLDRVALLGAPVAGAHLTGGSGLGTGNAVPARTLAQLLVLAASAAHPELRPLLSGLPVAGASGTLADRFAGAHEQAGLGMVRAKTGTLTGVSSLTGTVVDADGHQLGFVILADHVASTTAARTALDDLAAALAGCGCR